MKCFFCDIQNTADDKKLLETNSFFVRFDDFPITHGHVEIIPKKHMDSFFVLTEQELFEIYNLILKTKSIIDERFHPDGYNVGINEGRAAGRTIDHLHVHLIPRYVGDIDDPRGGVRNIIQGKGNYSKEMKELGREEYLHV